MGTVVTVRAGEVYRAPMRSRVDDIDAGAAVDWALAAGYVGVGVKGQPHEERRTQARLRRFAEAADGSYVWTRDGDGLLFLGQIAGPLVRDRAGEALDLVHVRPCRWHREPVDPVIVPAAVSHSFDRGGRNFQRINAPGVLAETSDVWERLESGR